MCTDALYMLLFLCFLPLAFDKCCGPYTSAISFNSTCVAILCWLPLTFVIVLQREASSVSVLLEHDSCALSTNTYLSVVRDNSIRLRV